jgi:predicted secreted protein
MNLLVEEILQRMHNLCNDVGNDKWNEKNENLLKQVDAETCQEYD